MDNQRASELFMAGGLSLTYGQYTAFTQYQEKLIFANRHMNLTSITEDEEVWRKHFLDSCLPLRYVTIPQGASLIDVGTGAGFPGLPLRIMREDLHLTLLDSLRKRVHFLESVCQEMKLPANCIHERAEMAGKQVAYREQYDVACARAVAALPVLCEYCLPFVRVGGMFLALKGPSESAEDARERIAELGGVVAGEYVYELGGEGRKLIVVIKEKPTPAKYPRSTKKIQANP